MYTQLCSSRGTSLFRLIKCASPCFMSARCAPETECAATADRFAFAQFSPWTAIVPPHVMCVCLTFLPRLPFFYLVFFCLTGELEEEMENPEMADLPEKQKHQLRHRELFLSRQLESLPATHIRYTAAHLTCIAVLCSHAFDPKYLSRAVNEAAFTKCFNLVGYTVESNYCLITERTLLMDFSREKWVQQYQNKTELSGFY